MSLRPVPGQPLCSEEMESQREKDRASSGDHKERRGCQNAGDSRHRGLVGLATEALWGPQVFVCKPGLPREPPRACPLRSAGATPDAALRQQDDGIRESEASQGQTLAPSTREACAGSRGPCQGPPPPPPEPTRLTMAMLSRLPMVRMARDSRSRGWVSTLSEMACSVPRAGQHLCGGTGSGGRRQHPDKEPTVQRPGGCASSQELR